MAKSPILGPDGRPTSASAFLVVHQALRRDLDRFPAAVRGLAQRPDGDRVAAFQDHWKAYRDIVDAHDEYEDKVLFPELRELAPGLGDLLDALNTKHADLTGMLDAASSWVEELPEETDQAVAALEEVAEFLAFHLDTEEAHLVSVMVSLLEPSDPEPPGTPESSEDDPSEDASSDHGAAPASGPVGVAGEIDDTSDVGDTDAGASDPANVDPASVGLDGFGSVPLSFALPWCADGLDVDVMARVLLADQPEPVQAKYPAWQEAYQHALALWVPQ